MSWYKTGTIAVTNGSKIITGTGTQFTNPLNSVSAGRMLLLPAAGTVQIYEIDSVQSDTQLTLVSAYTGTTETGKAYAIPTSPSVSIEQFAHEFASTLAYYQQQLSGWQQILTGAGNVTLTTPDGQTVTVRSQSAWDAALDGKLTAGDYGIGGAVPKPITQQGMHFSYSDTVAAGADVGLAQPGVGYQAAYNTNRRGQIFQSFGDEHLRHRVTTSATAADATTAWRLVWDNVNLMPADMYGARGALGTADLDTILGKDYRGIWDQGATVNATLARHYPIVSAGSLEVFYNAANGVGCVQRYTTHASNRVFIRYKAASSDAWSAWVEHWTSANLVKQASATDTTTGAVLTINSDTGSFGLGGYCVSNGDNWSTNYRNGFYQGANILPGDLSRRIYGFGAYASDFYGFQFGGRDGRVVFRTLENGTWSTVREAWHSGNLANPATLNTEQTFNSAKTFTVPLRDTVLQIGQTQSALPVLLTNVSQLQAMRNGQTLLVNAGGGSSSSLVPVATGYWHIKCVGKSDATVNAGNFEAFQLGLGYNHYAGWLNTDGTIVWRRSLFAGYNAVADVNGFWKTASPVVKLFTDGTSELTEEAQGVTTERISKGVYKISGCLGLNADRAWGGDEGGISIPRCRNDLPRLWVDYGGDDGSEMINQDGSIVIRTYHRPHPDALAFARNEVEGYANGDPIDIPRDTFISVRVQMPEADASGHVAILPQHDEARDVVSAE